MTTFDVTVETPDGKTVIVFKSIMAQTRAQACHIAESQLTFTAERNDNGEASVESHPTAHKVTLPKVIKHKR